MSTTFTRATEAQSRESIIAKIRAAAPQLEELNRLVQSVLHDGHRPEVEVNGSAECHPNDRTVNRIRAYVASMRGLRGVGGYDDEIEEHIQQGGAAIERLALSGHSDSDPPLRLSTEEVANVIAFLSHQEPHDLQNWWTEEGDTSHICGYYAILAGLEASLREPAGKGAPVQDEELVGVASVLRSAVRLFGEGDETEVDMDGVAELVRTAADRLTARADRMTCNDDGSAVFDALDACTAVLALIEAAVEPRNGKTISPIRGVLSLAVGRLESSHDAHQ